MKLPRFNEESYAHFITTKTFANQPIFRNGQCCRILLKNLDFYRRKLGFRLLGYVIMPDHWHCLIWWDAEKDPDLTISKIMRLVKSHSARQIVDYLYHPGRRGPLTSSRSKSLGQGTKSYPTGDQITRREYPHRRMSDQEYQIWQPSFYDFNIYSDKKFVEKLNYMHYNPVRAGLCKNAEDWRWSSYRDYELGENGIIEIERA